MQEKLKEKTNVGALSVSNTKKNLPNCALKGNKGITLVALIITIIVLLILVVVTIQAVQGDGIISHAKNAQTEYEKEQAKEAVQLALNEWEIVKHTQTEGNLKTFLEDKIPNSVEGGGPYIVTVDGYEVTVSEDGTITGTEEILPKPVVDEASIKITTDGTNVPAEDELTNGTSVQIYFEASIEGGEITSISPSVPYTTNGTEMSKEFTIVGTIDGKERTSKITISVAKYYKIDHSEVVIGTIAKTGVFANPYIAEVREGNIPIPTGFTYVKGDKKGGAVITDGTSEFVWVPTTTDIVAYGLNTPGFREPDVVTGANPSATVDGASGGECDAVVEANLKRVLEGEYANTKTAASFKAQLTAEFEAMATSVNKYDGFYVGRYEISYSETEKSAKSVSGVESAMNKTSDYDWYGLYAKAKTYTNSANSVVSRMIYGSQYNAMMTWMSSNGINVDNTTPTDLSIGVTTKNSRPDRKTGLEPKDKLSNIYDLLGNSYEWTQEASGTRGRVYRGGVYNIRYSPSYRNSYGPTTTYSDGLNGSRLSLYIKCY